MLQRERMFASWPGPVTYVVPASPHTPRWLTGRFDSLAIRVSDHPQVRALSRIWQAAGLNQREFNRSAAVPQRRRSGKFGSQFPVLQAATGGRLNSEIRDAISGELIRQG